MPIQLWKMHALILIKHGLLILVLQINRTGKVSNLEKVILLRMYSFKDIIFQQGIKYCRQYFVSFNLSAIMIDLNDIKVHKVCIILSDKSGNRFSSCFNIIIYMLFLNVKYFILYDFQKVKFDAVSFYKKDFPISACM